MKLIKEIHNFLQEDMQAMNDIIIERLHVDEDLIEVISNYLIEAGGKRLRPILTILVSHLFSAKNRKYLDLAAAVEFIHMATLLHDDVVDNSKLRRFLPTANVLWGPKASILVGDFLFSQAFKSIVAADSLAALDILSKASAVIAEGEVAQLAKLEEHRMLSEGEYLKIIHAKTAELFSASCTVGAIISDANKKDLQSIKNYGSSLGILFQIADDMLDYFSNSDDVGKNIGDDFEEGKVTLPLIFLYNKAPKEEQKIILKMIASNNRSSDEFDLIMIMLEKYKIKAALLVYLEKLKVETKEHLNMIEIDNEAKVYLDKLVDFAVERTF